MRTPLPRLLLTVAMFASSLAGIVATADPAAADIQVWTGPVIAIVDGDTFWYENAESDLEQIRILGIDTNETGDCWASGATTRLGEIISGETVRLEARDENSMSLGRLQRHVFVEIGGEWTNVAEIMLEEGWGLPMPRRDEYDYAEDYVAAALAPAQQGLRVWDDDSCGSGPSQSIQLDMWVNADAAGSDDSNLNGEWVDILNNSGSSINISNWTLRADGRQGNTVFTFPNGTTIGANDSIRIYSGSGSNDSDEFYWGQTEAWLPNDTGVMFLRDTDMDVRTWRLWPCAGGCGPTGTVVIEEIDYNAPGNDLTNPNGERISLRNVGPETITLDGWKLVGNHHLHLDGLTLSPGERHEVRIGSGTDSSSITYWGRPTGTLTNGGSTLKLITPYLDISDCFDWGSSSCGGDGIVGSIKLWANYNAPGNDLTNPNGEYVALENISNSTIDLNGYSLVDEPHRYTFGSVSLAPGAMVRVKVGTGTDTSTVKHWGKSGPILTNGGDSIVLEDPDGDEIMEHSWPCGDCGPNTSLVIDAINYNAPGNDLTNPNGEWVRIRNAGYQTENFRGWQIQIGPYQLTGLASRPLEPGETLTVYIGAGSNSGHRMHWGKSSGIMTNSGRTVKLVSPHREVVGCHGWGSQTCSTQSLSSAVELTANPDANGIDSSNPNGEWVNLTNVSSKSVNLDDYALYSPGHTYHFDGNDNLAPGARIRVRLGNGTDSGSLRYWGDGAFLDNGGDYVNLVKVSDWDTISHHSWPCDSNPCGATPNIEITTVVYDAAGDDNANVNGEYIVITNRDSFSIQVRDWQLVYKDTVQFNIIGSRVLDPGETLTYYMGDGSGSNHTTYMGYDSSRLANSGGKVELLTPLKDEVDCVDWGNWNC